MDKLIKEVKNGRMLKNTGSWLYCSECDKTVGYLCYSTYQSFVFQFDCKCGNTGSFALRYSTDEEIISPKDSHTGNLKTRKNRLCCPNDDAPLFSIVLKNIANYSYWVICNKCHTEFSDKNS